MARHPLTLLPQHLFNLCSAANIFGQRYLRAHRLAAPVADDGPLVLPVRERLKMLRLRQAKRLLEEALLGIGDVADGLEAELLQSFGAARANTP